MLGELSILSADPWTLYMEGYLNHAMWKERVIQTVSCA